MELRGRTHPGMGLGKPRYPGSFLLAFREAADRLNWQVRRWRGDAVECADAQGREQVVGLENLYRRARQTNRSDWLALISEFLNSVLVVNEDSAIPASLVEVADQLLLRLGQPLKLAAEGGQVWGQPLGETDLSVNLVVDYPNRMCYVTEKLMADSGRPEEDWLEKANANLLARTPKDCFKVVHDETKILLCQVGDAYDSSRALLLDRILPVPAPMGCLVSMPGRDELAVLPISEKGLAGIHMMKLLAMRNFKIVPYPISDKLYWVYQGVWRHFSVEVRGNEVNIRPPDEFVPFLKELGATEHQEPDSDDSSDV